MHLELTCVRGMQVGRSGGYPAQGTRGDAPAGQEMPRPLPVADSLCQHVSLLFSCPGTPVQP